MPVSPRPIQQRPQANFQQLWSRLRRLEARTGGIDSGFPVHALPAVIDPGYGGPAAGNPMAYVNGAAALSGPFAYSDHYTPLAGDAVLLVPVHATASYIVHGLPSARPWAAVLTLTSSGWTDASGNSTGTRCKYGAGGKADVSWTLGVGTTFADGTVIGTLPAAFYPANGQNLPATAAHSASGGQSPHFAISTGGQVACYGLGASGGLMTASGSYALT